MTTKRNTRTTNSFVDNNEQSEELILADLDLMREDWEIAPTSLADVMDDQKQNITNNHEVDPLNIIDDINTVDKTIVEPINIDITTNEDSINTNSVSLETPSNDPYPIAIEKQLKNDASDLININISNDSTVKNQQPDISIKTDFTTYESMLKKARLMSHVALAISLSALVAMTYLSTLVFETKASNAKLTDLVSILQGDIGKLTDNYEGLENNNKNVPNVSIESIAPQAIENTIEATKPIVAPTKNKIIHTVVKSIPLKKVDLQSHPIKHSATVVGDHKKNKTHK